MMILIKLLTRWKMLIVRGDNLKFSYEQFMMLFYIGIGISIVFFIVAIILFFVLKIPRVWSELSGSTERKAINKIREKNAHPKVTATEEMGAKVYNNISTGVNNNITKSESFDDNNKFQAYNNETQLLINNVETEILVDNNQPFYNGTVVEENESYSGQTQVLDDNETEILYETNELINFQLLDEIVLCASTEIIV